MTLAVCAAVYTMVGLGAMLGFYGPRGQKTFSAIDVTRCLIFLLFWPVLAGVALALVMVREMKATERRDDDD